MTFAIAAAAGALAMPTMAEGAIYYATQSGGGTECSSADPCSLDGAVARANADSTRDTVQVTGALTHAAQIVLSTPIDLVGSGRGDGGTFIDVAGSEFCALCIQATSTASNLRVRKTGSWDGVDMQAGTALRDATVQGVNSGVFVNQDAASEAVIERSAVTAVNGTSAAAAVTVNVGDANAEVRVLDSTFGGYFGLELNGPGRTIVQRTAIDAQVIGIALFDGRLAASSSSIRLRPGSFGGTVHAIYIASGTGEALTADLRQLTLDGSAVGSDRGIEANSANGTASTTVRGSIVRGFVDDLQTNGAGAKITVGTSDFSTTSAPSGSIDSTSLGGNLDVDPGYVDAGAFDYRLAAGSPLIDKAGSSSIAPDESPTDLRGASRIVDGNGDGTSARDIGAFESGAVAPTSTPAPPLPDSTPTPLNCTNDQYVATCPDPDGMPSMCGPTSLGFPQCNLPFPLPTVCGATGTGLPTCTLPGNHIVACGGFGMGLAVCNLPPPSVPGVCGPTTVGLPPCAPANVQVLACGATGLGFAPCAFKTLIKAPKPIDVSSGALDFELTCPEDALGAAGATASQVSRRGSCRAEINLGISIASYKESLLDSARSWGKYGFDREDPSGFDDAKQANAERFRVRAQLKVLSYLHFEESAEGGKTGAYIERADFAPMGRAEEVRLRAYLCEGPWEGPIEIWQNIDTLSACKRLAEEIAGAVNRIYELQEEAAKSRTAAIASARAGAAAWDAKPLVRTRAKIRRGKRATRVRVRLTRRAVRRLRRFRSRRPARVAVRLVVAFKAKPRPIVRLVDFPIRVKAGKAPRRPPRPPRR